MILNEICDLPKEHKAKIGLKIAEKYRAMTKRKPERIEIQENGITMLVNDYPEEWLKKHGQKVVDNFLAVRVGNEKIKS